MRKAFISSLMEAAGRDASLMLVTGDLGFNALEPFRDAFPAQYLNAGVAEQNMVGVAAGLALSGRRIFVYSIIPFVSYRCFEQVRDDVCYHRLPVTMVGVGSGYGYGILGSTHHSLEDLALMRSLPGMTVLSPGDPPEVAAAVRSLAVHGGPAYLRLGKAGEAAVHAGTLEDFAIGRAIGITEGEDVALFATGSILSSALEAARMLTTQGLSVRLLSMHTLKPLDEAAVRAALPLRLIVTLEEHGPVGGLGDAVARLLAGLPSHPPLLALSAPDAFAPVVGSQSFLRAKAGLAPAEIARRIMAALR